MAGKHCPSFQHYGGCSREKCPYVHMPIRSDYVIANTIENTLQKKRYRYISYDSDDCKNMSDHERESEEHNSDRSQKSKHSRYNHTYSKKSEKDYDHCDVHKNSHTKRHNKTLRTDCRLSSCSKQKRKISRTHSRSNSRSYSRSQSQSQSQSQSHSQFVSHESLPLRSHTREHDTYRGNTLVCKFLFGCYKTDEECGFDHPQVCRNFMTDERCYNKSCHLLHPYLCEEFLKQGICEFGMKCAFYHVTYDDLQEWILKKETIDTTKY
jgi:hypothetical protein